MSKPDHNTSMRGDHAAKLLDRAFCGGDDVALSNAEALALHEAIGADESLRARFDVLARAELALAREGAARGAFASELGEASFLAALDAQLDAELAGGDDASAPRAAVIPLFARQEVRAMLAAATALVIGGAVWQLQPGAPVTPEPDGFQARSAHQPGVKRLDGPRPTIEVFCVQRDADGAVQFSGVEGAPFGVVQCPRDAEVKFAYTAPDALQAQHLVLFGVDRRGHTLWYTPSPAEDAAHTIQPTERPRPVGESIHLRVNHAPGPVRVFGLFTSAPVSHAALRAWMESQEDAAWRAGTNDVAPVFPWDGTLAKTTFDVTEAR